MTRSSAYQLCQTTCSSSGLTNTKTSNKLKCSLSLSLSIYIYIYIYFFFQIEETKDKGLENKEI
jgi:hypothetical protein